MGKTSWLWFSAADTCGRKKLWVETSVLFVEVVSGSLLAIILQSLSLLR